MAQGSYSNAQLTKWPQRSDDRARKLDRIYVDFDNDDSAYAVNNALTLKSLLSAAGRRIA